MASEASVDRGLAEAFELCSAFSVDADELSGSQGFVVLEYGRLLPLTVGREIADGAFARCDDPSPVEIVAAVTVDWLSDDEPIATSEPVIATSVVCAEPEVPPSVVMSGPS